MKHVVIGTAGHIDHGKTSLVKALTGVDTDRLKEERERGITIDIGFAPLRLAPDLTAGFVDVPGHERFIRNMLAGVWGIDLIMLVVAADESIKPQTREHFDICSLLAVKRGVIALTKTDLVEPDLAELAALEVREFVRGSFLDAAPIVPVSSRTGAGIDGLTQALRDGALAVTPGRSSDLLRLPVDRSFSMKGFGTVVTGTLVSGRLDEGEEVAIWPAGTRCRVRGIQIHGDSAESAAAGMRVALNLQGVEAEAAARGDAIGRPGEMAPSHLLDVTLRLLDSAPRPLADMDRVRFHQGTSELLARVRLVGADELAPGDTAFAQLRLEKPGMCLPGDRFVIRRYSPPLTIGGGVVLDAHPAKHRGAGGPGLRGRLERLEKAGPGEALLIHLEGARGGMPLRELARRAGLTVAEAESLLAPHVNEAALVSGSGSQALVISRDAAGGLRDLALAALGSYHKTNPLRPGMPLEELRERALRGVSPAASAFTLERLAASGAARIVKETISLAGHEVTLSPVEQRGIEALEQAFRSDGLNPRTPEEIAAQARVDPRALARMMHLLLAEGKLVRIRDGRVFHARAIDELKSKLWEVRASRRIIDIGFFKELTGTSRKNAIPLLEHLDAAHVTRRIGSDREIMPPAGG